MRTRFFVPLLALFSVSTACAHEQIVDVRTLREIPRTELLARLADAETVVVGEKHSTPSIQNAEARLFADYAGGRPGRTTLAWEFWNWSERGKLENVYHRYLVDETTGTEFLQAMFGVKNPELTYLPLIEAAKSARAEVMATNLSRAEKAPVVEGGLAALDPVHLPPDFVMGGASYRERFLEAAGGHGDPRTIENYFISQCLVDDVAAYHVTEHRPTPSLFLVIGGFHSRYFDGVWKRIEERAGHQRSVLIEVADPGDEDDWKTVLNHPRFGPVADYVIFTDRVSFGSK